MFLWLTHQNIDEGSQDIDEKCVQVGEQVPLRRQDGCEKAAKYEAGQVWDDHWYRAESPAEHHPGPRGCSGLSLKKAGVYIHSTGLFSESNIYIVIALEVSGGALRAPTN